LRKKIAIIGAGWFGCHIALEILKLNKFEIQIFERNKDIFNGASSNNQNRLHLGFHYPRSKITRKQSKEGFKKFIKTYPFLCKKIKNNIYSIANNKDSYLDFETYLQIIKAEKLKYKIFDEKRYNIKSVAGSISTDEMLIDVEKSKNFFRKKLNSFLNLDCEIKQIKKIGNKYSINNKLYDYVVNCTYYQNFIKINNSIIYEVTSSLIYKNKQPFPALTIMDGPFFTIYPYKKNYFNIYSVVHSRFAQSRNIKKCENFLSKIRKNEKFLHNKRNLIETQIEDFYPVFKKNFKFKKYLTCVRTINNSNNAERSYKLIRDKNFFHIYSGKIDHIMSAAKEVIGSLIKN
jgi:hypothetical protein